MIRPATPADFNALYRLYQRVSLDKRGLNDPSYQTLIQKTGFLVGGDSKKEMKRLIERATLVLAYEQNNKIFGFAVAGTEHEYQEDQKQRWFDQRMRNIYFKNPHSVSLLSIAVNPKAHRKGIGHLLFNRLELDLRKRGFKHLFAVITLSPVTNCPSLIFHAKHEFTRVAMEYPGTVFGVKHYSSVMMYKKL